MHRNEPAFRTGPASSADSYTHIARRGAMSFAPCGAEHGAALMKRQRCAYSRRQAQISGLHCETHS